MDKIPSLIPTIVFIGKMNSGKSSLINALTDQDIAIVSNIPGTTTDEVVKRYELLNIGPVNIIDTAGLNDKSRLGSLRINKTKKAIKRASLLLYLVDASEAIELAEFNAFEEDKLLVITKTDLISTDKLAQLTKEYPNGIFVSVNDQESIAQFKAVLTEHLHEQDDPLLQQLELKANKIVHVIPIDSEAPKGRIILPQMQLLRECLDMDLISIVLKESELALYLKQNDDIGLIVTDSQAFNVVSSINRQRFPLTSYSILQANQKGDLAYFVASLNKLKNLPDKARILVMESCSHNASHEDIGRIKIPKLLTELLTVEFTYDFKMGHDFPQQLAEYDFIIHCGSCMLSKSIMIKRIRQAQDLKIPLTNYGLLFAYANGILTEAIAVFK